ncbi:MAG: CpaF family protein [Clostridia bacterium]|nr:ATPase, T2SS/T4P/T4SS family [Lachnospiraceae bacterium]NCB99645.1 CpaF family protein [Clostridia bacterium]NCD01849.1 CpaF family protein [Clostridia bacterium]
MEKQETYQTLKKHLQESLLRILEKGSEWSDEEIMIQIDKLIIAAGREVYLSGYKKLMLKQELFNAVRRLDLLQELVDDKEITEIMVNGVGDIFYEKEGHIYRWSKSFESAEKLEDVIQQIVAGANRQVNEASPIVDARLADGSRVNVVLKPVALNGPILTIRKFPEEPMSIEKLITNGALTEDAAAFLEKIIQAKYNIFISGGTGTGKTTMLNALMDYVPRDERVITIEDSAELQIHNIENLVKLEARNATADGEHQVTIRDLIKSAMRMRPDRICVGEVRGAESVDMIQAMSSGHDGSISTGHSGSPEEMLSRLETMVLMGTDIPLIAIRKQIASAIDIIIQLERLRDKSRRVTEITEVVGFEDGEIKLNPIFVFKESTGYPDRVLEEGSYMASPEVEGQLVLTGNPLIHRKKLEAAALSLEEGI